jgi:periplasmic divalent cation tolerance protein
VTLPAPFVTAPPAAPRAIASALLEEGLAACVTRLPCRSTYRWEGGPRGRGGGPLAKTTDARYGALRDRVRELHPHDVPCIERSDEPDVVAE